MRNLSIVFLAGWLVCGSLQADESPKVSLSSLITEGPVKLDVMKIVPSNRATVLRVKMELALVENRDWYLQYAKSAKPGEPLPYDSRFGVTEAEYAEMLEEHKKNALVKDSSIDARIVIQHNIARIESDKPLGESLLKLRINLANNELTSIDGKVGAATYTSNDAADTPVGPWQGYSWKVKNQNEDFSNASRFSLEILRRKQNGRVIWVFSDSKLVDREVERNYSVTFEYD